MKDKIPTLTLTTPIQFPEEGFLLGNGDLSVSVHQTGDTIRLRLGKGDVWDRRADFSNDPKPTHIAEVAAGILEEGWTCGPYGGPVYAARGKGETTIHSEQGNLCILKNPWPGENVLIASNLTTKKSKIEPTKEDTLVLDLPKGSTCRLTRYNEPLKDLDT